MIKETRIEDFEYAARAPQDSATRTRRSSYLLVICSQHCGNNSPSVLSFPIKRAKATHPMIIICLCCSSGFLIRLNNKFVSGSRTCGSGCCCIVIKSIGSMSLRDFSNTERVTIGNESPNTSTGPSSFFPSTDTCLIFSAIEEFSSIQAIFRISGSFIPLNLNFRFFESIAAAKDSVTEISDSWFVCCCFCSSIGSETLLSSFLSFSNLIVIFSSWICASSSGILLARAFHLVAFFL
mmetsp:Transcript_22971/g.29317  ORF Transcript_22971/g.29317 Transcript_22971/m.29317 type:complete len:237 (-) Transcript_22971:712-1422(-)